MFKASDIKEIMLETEYRLHQSNWSDILPKVEFIKIKDWKSRLRDKPFDYNLDLFHYLLHSLLIYQNLEIVSFHIF